MIAIKYWSRMNELICFNWKYPKRTRTLSKNDKFVTNETKNSLFCDSLIFFNEIITIPSVDSFYISAIDSENLQNETKNWYSTKKMKKPHVGNTPQSDFL